MQCTVVKSTCGFSKVEATVQPGAPGRLHIQSAEDVDLLVPARFLAAHEINSRAHRTKAVELPLYACCSHSAPPSLRQCLHRRSPRDRDPQFIWLCVIDITPAKRRLMPPWSR